MEWTRVCSVAIRFCHSSAGRLVCRNLSSEASSTGAAGDGEEGPMAMVWWLAGDVAKIRLW
jgi:hypothetical protein